MRVSELAAASGVTVPSIKYYLREGLLMPGEARNATQAEYGELHVRRLRLIRALADVAGLPVQQIKTILSLIDRPGGDLFETLGIAVGALPPYVEKAAETPDDFPRARAALTRLGQIYDPEFPAVAQLERALAAVESAGIPMTDERLEHYARGMRTIARFDLATMPGGDPAAAIEYAVVGTALYEPVIVALRRLAHQDIAARQFAAVQDAAQESATASAPTSAPGAFVDGEEALDARAGDDVLD